MKLLNKTKDKIITDKLKTLKYIDKVTGLIGKEKPEPVYFKTRWGIHTRGLRFPIDIIVADEDMVVKKIESNLEPNRFFFWNPVYKNIFELPSNTLKNKIDLGDKLKII